MMVVLVMKMVLVLCKAPASLEVEDGYRETVGTMELLECPGRYGAVFVLVLNVGNARISTLYSVPRSSVYYSGLLVCCFKVSRKLTTAKLISTAFYENLLQRQ